MLVFLWEAKKSVLVVKEIRLSLDVLLRFCIFLKNMNYDLIIDFLPFVTIWQESCRKMFSLDALLLDAFGEPVDKELEVCSRIHYFKCFQLQ